MRKGMKVGSSHNWNYRENRYTSNGKNFVIYQSKGRNSPSPRGSGMPLGSKLIWKIKGNERVGKPVYIRGKGWMTPIKMWGIKRQAKYKLPKRRWR